MIGALLLVALALNTGALVVAWWLDRPACARTGHRWTVQYAPTRVYLTCDVCALESPGWNLFDPLDGCQRYDRRS